MSKTRRFISTLAILVTVLIGYLVVANQQMITDRLAVFQYVPSDGVAYLADGSSMSKEGRFYFYAGHPEMVDATSLNQHCQRQEGSNPILGCFSKNRIYIFDIQDEELDGIKEVTAAHEMLHFVYSRLSRQEIQEIEPKLEAAYSRLKTPDLEKRMEVYQSTEPGQRYNELHSILATEFDDLGPELNNYFDRYFNDRRVVVALHEGYSGKFAALQGESQSISKRLQADREVIDAMSASYYADVSSLNDDIARFNAAASSGGYSNEVSFSQARSQLAARSRSIEQRRLQLEARISRYNSDVEKLNSLGQEIEKLNSSIDSFEGVK